MDCWAAQSLARAFGEVCSWLVAGWFGVVPECCWDSLDDLLGGDPVVCWAAQFLVLLPEEACSRLVAGWFGPVPECCLGLPDDPLGA